MGLNTFTIPQKLLITSDNNQLQFITKKKINKEDVYVYRFIVSECKMGLEMFFTEKELGHQFKNFFKVIE